MPSPAVHARTRARVLMETLEPRILYSADLAAVAVLAGSDTGLVQTQVQALRLQTPAATTVGSAAEIAFVDLGVPEAGTLVSDLLAQRAAGRLIEVVTFTAGDDGLAVIGQTLAERQADGARFDAVHVFSHGSAGAVQLGTSVLDADSLLQRAAEIAGWSGALAAQADLMLYGCDVADGAQGLFLIEGLAALTGADVAASDNLTGSAALGGDWQLEQHTGQIEARVALDAAGQQAWGGTLSNEIQVNTTTSGTQTTDAETRGSQQAVAMDDAGNYTVVWTSGGQDGGGKGVYARRFAFDGTALTGELQVNTTTSHDQENARIVGDGAGNFTVVWSSKDQDSTSSSVYFRRFAADGTALTGEIRANATSTGAQSNAVIGMNTSNGDVVVAWEGAGPTAGAVYFRRFTVDGTALDTADRAVSTTGGEANATVAMDATGRFVIAWERSQHLYFQRYDAAGVASGSTGQADNGLSNSTGAAIAMDASGNFALVYREQTTVPGIWGRAFNADGSARGFWFYADTGDSTAAGDATSPSISLAADGSAVVVYQRTGDGDKLGVYARKISASGSVQGSVFLANQTTANDQLAASVAVHDIDHFVVVWSGDSAADNKGVYARTFATANTAPVLTSNGGGATAAVSVAENTTAVTTVVASDADFPTQTLTYAIVGGADQTKFAIDSVSGVLRFLAAPDFEVPTDVGGDNVYNVTVQASDGLLTDTQALAVTVTAVNEAAPVITSNGGGATAAVSVAENTTAVTTVVASDADFPTQTLTYAIVGGADQTKFAIDSVSGVLRFLAAPDFEAPTDVGGDSVYNVTVQASDGLLTDTQALAVTLADVNEYAVSPVTDGDAALDAVDENAAIGTSVGLTAQATDADGSHQTVTYALDDSAGGRFAIGSASGMVTVAGLLDAETALSHTITVRATSADGSVSSQSFTIAVQDVNESGVGAIADFDSAVNAVREDAAIGTAVGFQAGAVDPDATNHTVTYALVSSADGRFAIDATSGVVTVAAALDAEVSTSHQIEVRATSSDGSFTTRLVTLTVQDVNEFDVTVPSDADATANTVQDMDLAGATVGLTAFARDADASLNQITYTLSDDAAGRFAVDASTGVITLARSVAAEVGHTLTLVVQATSADGSTATRSFTVSVTAANLWAPVIGSDGGGATAAVTVPENSAAVTTVMATDADRTPGSLRYTLTGGADQTLFTLDADSGVLRFVAAPDAEAPRDAGADNVYEVVVQVRDGLRTATQTLAITVADVNEAAVSALVDTDTAANTVLEHAAVGTSVGLQVQAVDADATDRTVTYALDDSAGGHFSIDASTGVVRVAAVLEAETALSHALVVRATSADGSTATASFTIAVLPVNESAPVITSDGGGATATRTAAEGQVVVTQVLAQDADLPAETLRYTITGGADAALFTLDPASGVLRSVAAPDFEAPLDQGADNVYEVTVQVSDGLYTDEQALRIAVQPVNDLAPVITSDGGGATALRHVDENTLEVTQVQARDGDQPADMLTYAVSGGADAALFTIDATTGLLRWRAAPDHETPRAAGADGVYAVVVSVSDGLHTASQALVVVVDNVDEAPVLEVNLLVVHEGGTARPVLVATDVDTPATALVYTVQDLAGGRFEPVATPGVAVTRFTQAEVDAGAIQLVADGGEAAPAYRLVLRDGSTALPAQAAQVRFTPVNDAPVVAAVDLGAIDEDGARVITAAELLAGATDAEGDALSVSGLRLAAGEGTLVDLGGGRWRFDPAADWHGAVALAGEVSDGQALVALGGSLQVRAVNDAPRVVSGGGADTVAVEVAENTVNVTTVVGADVDAEAPLRYAVVGGADAALFQIDAVTGMLSFHRAPDHEQPADADGDKRYDVTVEVSDGTLRAQQVLQVTVTNVDEAPVVIRNTLLISDGAVTLVLQVRDEDTPATALVYRVDAVEGGQFEAVAAPGRAVSTFTQADLDAARVTWVATAGSTSAAFALRLNDGRSEVVIGVPTRVPQSVGTAAATAVEMAVQAVGVGDAAAVPAAGEAVAQAGTALAAVAPRRAEPLPPQASPESSGDAMLGVARPAADGSAADHGGNGRPVDGAEGVVRTVAARVAQAAPEPQVEPALDLPSESVQLPKRLVTEADLWGARSGTSLAEQIDRMRREVADAQQAGLVSVASTALVSTGLSVGYVVWLVRGGVLMSSLMSVVPAWAGMDPLPVLANLRGAEDEEAGDDPIEMLFSKARRLLVRPAAEGSA